MNKQFSTQEDFQGEQAGRYLFLSGRLCLDFVHTGGVEERQVFEEWHQPADIAEWFALSPLRAEGVEVLPADVRTAYALREAIWSGALAILRGAKPEADTLAVINELARQPDLAPQLMPGEAVLRWADPLTAQAAFSTIARDALDLFAGEQAQRLRQCANPHCLLLFVDTSHPGKRRWCSMQRCGNITKTARYRSHRRSQRADASQP